MSDFNVLKNMWVVLHSFCPKYIFILLEDSALPHSLTEKIKGMRIHEGTLNDPQIHASFRVTYDCR